MIVIIFRVKRQQGKSNTFIAKVMYLKEKDSVYPRSYLIGFGLCLLVAWWDEIHTGRLLHRTNGYTQNLKCDKIRGREKQAHR